MFGMLYSPPVLASVGFAIRQSNLSGKVIVGLLLVGSIFVWSIMITKFVDLRRAERVSLVFVSAFRKDAHPVSLYLKRRAFQGSPLYNVYEQTCDALGSALEARGADKEDLFMGAVGSADYRLDEMQLGSVRNVLERMVSDQAMLMENNMGLLATATTTAPFLGLLGTVWGVMDAFGGMAVRNTALLSDVAPGISGALLTTVVGLVVALPSAIGYNVLSDKIRRLTVSTDNFSRELFSQIELHYLQRPPHP